MPILGSGISDTNVKLRFCLIVFGGIICFGAVMVWRSETLLAAAYQEMPITHEQIKIKNENNLKKSLQQKLMGNRTNELDESAKNNE